MRRNWFPRQVSCQTIPRIAHQIPCRIPRLSALPTTRRIPCRITCPNALCTTCWIPHQIARRLASACIYVGAQTSQPASSPPVVRVG